MKTRIASYGADAGSLVINGIGFNNGFGDGGFDVYYVDRLPQGAKLIDNVWIDLRNGYDVVIHSYDCNKKGNEYEPNKVIPRKMFGDAKALQVAYRCGTMFLVKWF